MTDFIGKFDLMKRDILENILGIRISDNKWFQCCLSTSDAGLGYQDVKRMAHPAYISSLVQCSNILEEISPTIFSSDIPMIRSFHASLNANAQLSASTPLTYDDVKSILIEATKSKETLQSRLFFMQKENTVLNFQDTIRDSKQLAWIISLTSSNSKASRWLDVTPKLKSSSSNLRNFKPYYVTGLCYHSLFMFLNLSAIVSELLNWIHMVITSQLVVLRMELSTKPMMQLNL